MAFLGIFKRQESFFSSMTRNANLIYEHIGLGERVCEILKEQKISNKQLAGVLNVEPPFVSAALKGKEKHFNVSHLSKICNYTRANPAYLLWGVEPKYMIR